MPKLPTKPVTILHTSDWHLGRRLYGRMRYEEFEAFLAWLEETIRLREVDILLVAGDIFDTMTPSNRAQNLYYDFLGNMAQTDCQHIVIVAGNHDSPTFLDAPSQLLKCLNVHVIGTACDDLNDEVLLLPDKNGEPCCIIAAVPYLRDRDVRSSGAGESMDSKDANVISGIRAHYDGVAMIAKAHQQRLHKAHNRYVPIIATGHLFAAGSTIAANPHSLTHQEPSNEPSNQEINNQALSNQALRTDDDGVRDLYVGNLGKISADMFDDCFDYVALGHLHVPQRVGGCEHIRYSGSPIAMGFGESKQQKQVLLVQYDSACNKHNYKHNHKHNRHISCVAIPCFQPLAQVSGDMQTIKATIQALTTGRAIEEPIWLEVSYTGEDIVANLREQVAAITDGLACEVLISKNQSIYHKILNQELASETLQDLHELEVFERCLTLNAITDAQKPRLRDAYEQILYAIYHDDHRAQ